MSVSERPRPVDAPVVADGLPVQADRASRRRRHSLLTYSQADVALILTVTVHTSLNRLHTFMVFIINGTL